MLCPRCGTGVGDSVKLCAGCQSQFDAEQEQRLAAEEQTRKKGRPQEELQKGEHFGYAGFWIRYLALLIDTTICTVIIWLLQFIAGLLMRNLNWSAIIESVRSQLLNFLQQHQINSAGALSVVIAILLPVIIYTLIYIVVSWAYFALLDSSDGSTPGKQLVGLRVSRPDGQVAGLGRVSARHFLKLLSSFFYIGYFFNLFSPYRQTLHDLLTDCVVVKVRQVNPLLLWLYAFLFFFFLFILSHFFEVEKDGEMKPFSNRQAFETRSVQVGGEVYFIPENPTPFKRRR